MEIARGQRLAPRDVKTRKIEAGQILVAEWKERIVEPRWGLTTIVAVRPIIEERLEMWHGTFSLADADSRICLRQAHAPIYATHMLCISQERTPGCHHWSDCGGSIHSRKRERVGTPLSASKR